MRFFYNSLPEKDRRCYAAIEAEKLGHGGINYISKLLGISPGTVRRGMSDLDDESESLSPEKGERKKGVAEKAS